MRDLRGRVQQLESSSTPAPAVPVIPANVRIDQPGKFQGQHDGDTVREFVRAMDSFFALAGITDITW